MRHQKNITKTYPSQYFFQNKQKKENTQEKGRGRYTKKSGIKKRITYHYRNENGSARNLTNKTYPITSIYY